MSSRGDSSPPPPQLAEAGPRLWLVYPRSDHDARTNNSRISSDMRTKWSPSTSCSKKLESGRPLRVKLGLDPTAPSVTLGWAVVLRKLRHFQEMGHIAVLIVGDFTARVGDPSLRSDTRKRLTAEEVNGFAENVWGNSAGSFSMTASRSAAIRNGSGHSTWAGCSSSPRRRPSPKCSSDRISPIVIRRAARSRSWNSSIPCSQGYDSVAVEADVELGGSDQLWNLMMGRVVQERYGQEPQVALTMPLLVGTDGSKKMSQSIGNYIGVEDEPGEMFGKTMSIPDQVMPEWFRLAADFDPDEVDRIEAGLASGELHPGETKRQLARAVTALYWGADAAVEAEAGFDQVFRHGGTPEDIEDFLLPAGGRPFSDVRPWFVRCPVRSGSGSGGSWRKVR